MKEKESLDFDALEEVKVKIEITPLGAREFCAVVE